MPRISQSASDEHEFYSLEQRRFEHFAAALHEAQPGILSAKVYAPDGQAQFGIDHVAFKRDAKGRSTLEVGQSKAYRRFQPSDLVKATNKFLENLESKWRPMNVRKLIIFVGCVIKSGKTDDALIAETARFAELGLELELWDAWKIYGRLGNAPQVVWTHLGREYHARLFGDASAPFADLQRELLSGNMSGQRAMGLIVRLNQAETAELKEFKRRVHRGEAGSVYDQLEIILHQPGVSEAIAPDVRAGMERLLGGLAIARGDYPYGKLLLDRADSRDGNGSARLRAMLMLESEGPDVLLAHTAGATGDGVGEVRAVAHLRMGNPDRALNELAEALNADDPAAEVLRLTALSVLVQGDRMAAVDHARRAVAREPEMQATRQALAISLFNSALSPAVKPELGEWPQPVDLAFVRSEVAAQERLEEAVTLFATLDATAHADSDRDMFAAWHIAALTLRTGRRDAAVAAVSAMEAGPGLSPAIIAWAMSHALPFDQHRAAIILEQRLATDGGDLQAILVRVALANYSLDRATAQSLLAQHRDALVNAGHGEIHRYWQAVTDLEAHRTPDQHVVRQHPWLDLRAALATHSKKARLKAVSKVVDRQAGSAGDRRVLLAGSQMLLEGGWFKLPAKHASLLVEEIGTAEAIVVGAQALHLAGDQDGALAALEKADAFRGGTLPEAMDRLRIACLAAIGKLPAAAKASALLAAQSRSPHDLWSSINLHISTGAVPDALALWTANEDILKDPTPGHIMLARAAIHVDPEAARRITAQIAPTVPDAMVTAAYDLSTRLGMRERGHLMRRIIRLGSSNSAGVLRIDSVEQALAMIEERQQAIVEAQVKYNQGHAPIHVLATWRPGAIAAAYLGSKELTDARRAAGELLGARYGRRFDSAAWPAERTDVHLVADVTALLTAHQLDLLDKIERAFKPIRIGPDALNAIASMRIDLDEMQPDRMDAMRTVSGQFVAGSLATESEAKQLDPFTVLWSLEGREPNSTLNFTRLFDALRPHLAAGKVEAASAELGNTIDEPPEGAVPPAGSMLTLEIGMAVLLEQAGILNDAMQLFQIQLPAGQIDILDGQLKGAEERQVLLGELSRLYDRLAAGVSDGTYEFVAPVKEQYRHPLAASMMQALASVGKSGAIFWVDDRFISSIDNPQVRVVTSAEVIDELYRFDRIDVSQLFAFRRRLRAIDWAFLPIRGDELFAATRTAIAGRSFAPTEELLELRRGLSMVLRHRRLVQWPDAQALDQGVHGEVPFLLDLGHAASGTVTALWSAKEIHADAAALASSWLLEHLDIDQYPMQVLPSSDPRSDHLQGLRLAHLILNALQIIPVGPMRERQKQYLSWIWHAVVAPRLEDRPEMASSMMAMLEEHLVGIDDPLGAKDERDLWYRLTGTFLDSLPEPLRDRVLSRPAIKNAYSIERRGIISIGDVGAEEADFWAAIAALAPGRPVPLKLISADRNTKRTASLSLEAVATSDHHIRVKLEAGGYRIDDWCWRVSQDDLTARRVALEERAERLDLSPAELDDLNDDLGAITDRTQRIRHAELAAARPMAAWYARFAIAAGERHGFALHELMPNAAGSVLSWLRLQSGKTLGAAASDVAAERGLLAMIDRFGALPIEPDAEMAALFARGTAEERGEAEKELPNLPPWHALFVLKLLYANDMLDRSGTAKARRIAVAATVDPAREKEWRLFASLARYVASQAPELEDWQTLDAQGQLAFVWAHASKLAIVLIAARVDPGSVTDYLEKVTTVSPRELMEASSKYGPDCASPFAGSPARLRARAALSILLALRGKRASGPVHAALQRILMAADGQRGNEALLPATLAPSALHQSFFRIDHSRQVADAFPLAQFSFGDALLSMVAQIFSESASNHAFRRVWTFLRQASGDAPLPTEVAVLARARLPELSLSERPDGLEPALHTIIAVTALAAVNDWPEWKERVDAAVAVTWDDADNVEDRAQIFFEIAHWRARLEPSTFERGRVVVAALRRIATDEAKREWAISVAQRSAKAFAGLDAEPFIDFIAEMRS